MIRRLEFWALRIAAIVVTGTLVYTIGVKHGENQPTTTADLELGLTVAPETPCDLPRPRSFRVAVIHALPSIPHYDRDHRVPWQEAMQSGLCDRTDAERRAFYNDISNLWPITFEREPQQRRRRLRRMDTALLVCQAVSRHQEEIRPHGRCEGGACPPRRAGHLRMSSPVSETKTMNWLRTPPRKRPAPASLKKQRFRKQRVPGTPVPGPAHRNTHTHTHKE